ncbi:hypothetical protein [Planococcus sp. S3-L1]|uniref:hypothetical protein n=1 Tax=Planococcus sp. S3-L1 TaxID=3046200 RepID=UPI0024BB90B7|nr:hypothetical protein [Planococcus sp. S3-L1]MDJ0333374.1 hypothetical protein [Planococcus sp. S3-L1]
MAIDQVTEVPVQEKSIPSLFSNRSFIFLWLSSTASFLALSTYLFTEQWYIITVLEKESLLGTSS